MEAEAGTALGLGEYMASGGRPLAGLA